MFNQGIKARLELERILLLAKLKGYLHFNAFFQTVWRRTWRRPNSERREEENYFVRQVRRKRIMSLRPQMRLRAQRQGSQGRPRSATEKRVFVVRYVCFNNNYV
jgi:hypothetical protein